MKVAAIQHDIVWESPAANFARLAPMIADAASGGARLVALTEMFATGFSMDAPRVAEAAAGASVGFLVEQATTHGVWVCGSIPTLARAGAASRLATNTFTLVSPDGHVQRYDKLHPFSYAGEHEQYAAGATMASFAVEGVRVTPFVCYDLRFGDDWWAAAPHTDLYVCVANWPASRRAHWTTLLAQRAIENQAYVLGVNRVGDGNNISYAGDSRLVDPFGETVFAADPNTAAEQVLVADVDVERVRDVRSKFPFLRDRRTHATD